MKDNLLLALFIGFIDNGCSEDGYLIHPITNHDTELKDLDFSEDWNLLMRVVDKIEGLKYIVKHGRHWGTWVEDDLENDYFCTITDGYNNIIADCAWEETLRIKAVFKACVEFVKWYNEDNLK